METLHLTYGNICEGVRIARPASLGRFMRGVNPDSHRQGAGWCSAPALSTQLQHLKQKWTLPSSAQATGDSNQGLCSHACFVPSASELLWGEKKPFFDQNSFLIFLSSNTWLSSTKALFSPHFLSTLLVHQIQQTRSTQKENRAPATSHRLLVSFWSWPYTTTIWPPS